MHNILFKHAAKAISEMDFVEFQEKFEFAFPKELRKLLLQFNGGYPNKAKYWIDGKEMTLDFILPLKYGDMTIEEVKSDLNLEGLLLDYLPFGIDPGGGYFCLKVQGENVGAVYKWSHDYDGSFLYLEKSLVNFLKKLV